MGVVGAGPAGLAMAHALNRRNISFAAFDAARRPGGLWDCDRTLTPIYDSTHTISSSALSGFEGFPMPRDFPDYPSHRRVQEYLVAFYDSLGCRDRFEFGVEVTELRRHDEGWTLLSEGEVCADVSSVVLATGHQWDPNLPRCATDFQGEQLHSLLYKSPDVLRGKNVLIVGGGNTACDIACDAAPVAQQVWLSMRRGYHFLPRHIGGVPTDQFSSRLRTEAGSKRAAERMEVMLRTLVGDVSRLGFRKPTHRPFEANPLINTTVLHYVAQGDVEPRRDVVSFDIRTASFDDGSECQPDVIVFATGYRHRVPLAEPWVGWRDGRPELLLNMFPLHIDDLYVLGLFETAGAAFPILSLQAELAALCIQRSASPTAGVLARLLAGLDQSSLRSFIPTSRHAISVERTSYVRALETALGGVRQAALS